MITAGPAHRARLAAVEALGTAGIGSPQYDAAELLSFALGVPRGLLPLAGELSDMQAAAYAGLVARRAAREPLQHILGVAGFFGLELQVGPGVFIPRPETELLVESALHAVADIPAPTVIDLCSGSGAIAIAIATARPTAGVLAVERSADATGWLRRNVDQLAPQVHLRCADALDLAASEAAELLRAAGGVDLVTCNPPYVPVGTTVDAETAAHDPHVAVFGGADGLDLIRALIPRIALLLRPGGTVLLEHDASHQHAVCALFSAGGQYTSVEGLRDLTGRPRFVSARRG